MIIDKLENAAVYYALCPQFEQAFRFALNEGQSCGEGRFPLGKKGMYALSAFFKGQGQKDAMLEAHRAYIDIQVSLQGSDLIGWKDLAACRGAQGRYSRKKDVILFKDVPELWFRLQPGWFCIFFPHDAHAPLAGRGRVRKLVVKVPAGINKIG